MGLLDSPNSAHRCLASRALGRITSPQAVPPLIGHLWDVDEDVAIDAAEALGIIGDDRAEAPLCELFENAPLGDLKLAAIKALGNLGGTRALHLLLDVAANRDDRWPDVLEDDWDCYWDAQLAAIDSLGRIGEPRAARIIAGVLADDSPDDLAEPALQACMRLGGAGIAVILQRLREAPLRERRTAARLLAGRTEPGCHSALCDALDDADASVRAAAVYSLAAAEEPIEQDVLSTLLADESTQVRQSAISFLEGRSYHEHQGTWDKLLADTSPEVRRTALAVLGSRGELPALPALVRSLADPESEVVCGAIAALGALGIRSCVHDLAELLRQEGQPANVRLAAIATLDKMPTPEGNVLLEAILGDHDPAVRIAGLHALARQETPETVSLLIALAKGEYPPPERQASQQEGSSPHRAPQTESAPEANGEHAAHAPAVPQGDHDGDAPRSTLEAIRRGTRVPSTPPPQIEDHLSDDERVHLAAVVENLRVGEQLLRPRQVPAQVDLKQHALKLLGRLSHDQTCVVLLEALESTEEIVRLAALHALAEIGDPKAKGAMLALLHADSPAVRLAAIRGLRAIADGDVVAAVSAAWPDPDPTVRCGCVAALEHVRGERVGALLRKALADPDPLVARSAAETILQRGDASALPEIVEAVLRHPEFNWDGLGRMLLMAWPRQAPSAFLDILQEPGRDIETVRLTVGLLEEMAPSAV